MIHANNDLYRQNNIVKPYILNVSCEKSKFCLHFDQNTEASKWKYYSAMSNPNKWEK